jgi:hypothetical protein
MMRPKRPKTDNAGTEERLFLVGRDWTTDLSSRYCLIDMLRMIHALRWQGVRVEDETLERSDDNLVEG